ncbi:hypothetical protein BN193_05725 [Lactococcus raffinolactis 4877]|nr:hypothetical protein BN193_05725 [Lactococcus raffinolactis 4877]
MDAFLSIKRVDGDGDCPSADKKHPNLVRLGRFHVVPPKFPDIMCLDTHFFIYTHLTLEYTIIKKQQS